MDTVGLKLNISADVKQALQGIDNLSAASKKLATEGVGNINAVSDALEALRKAQKDAGDTASINKINKAIKDLEAEANKLKNAGTEGFDEFGNAIKKTESGVGKLYTGLRVAANILPGLGISGILLLAGEGLASVASKLPFFQSGLFSASAAAKKLEENSARLIDVLKKLKEAEDVTSESVGGEAGNIARVRILAQAIQDTTRSYKERQNALTELRETNKAYFGDLTLEAESLKTLANRINEYSQALISEAIVKGQVEEIANVSKELTKQDKILKTLRDSRDALENRANKAAANVSPAINLGQGAGAGATAAQDAFTRKLNDTNDAVAKQQKVVLTLRTQIAEYNGELTKAITEQIKFKPLQDDKSAKTRLESLEAILKEIASINKELTEADTRPLFKRVADSQDKSQIALISQQIKDAVTKGAIAAATDKNVADAYDELAKVLRLKLQKLQNPNLLPSVDFTLADATTVGKAANDLQDKIEKQFGKPIKLDTPIQTEAEFKLFDPKGLGVDLSRAIQDAMKSVGDITAFAPDIRIQLEKAAIGQQLDKQLGELLNPAELEKKLASSGLESLGQSIGDALSKGLSPIAAAGKAIFTALGGLIQDIGKNLIEYGIAKSFLDSVLASGIALPGVAAIGLGLAAEAIGALVKGVGANYRAMATGGIVTGPTYALVGEAGPEVVFPLNQLNRFVSSMQGTGSQSINVTGQISGNNLALVMARTNKQRNLV